MLEDLANTVARTLFFLGIAAMVGAVFFSPMLLFLRRRHLHVADRSPRRVPDAICWINTVIGLYLIHSLLWVYLTP